MEAIADAQWVGMDERPSARIGADIHHFRFDPSQALKLHAGAIVCSPTTLTWRKVRSVAQNLLRSEVVDTPPIKALDRRQVESAPGCSCSEDSIEAVSVPSIPSAEEATVGVNGLSALKPEQNGFSFEI